MTNKGRKAFLTHLNESKKIPLRQKLIFKAAGFKQELISKDPYVISLEIRNRHSENPSYIDLLIGEVINALEKNGAKKDQDYIVEIEGQKGCRRW